MNKIEIQQLLHHRPPYLLLDQALEWSDHDLVAIKTPESQEFYIQGHFPGAHVVPGAIMQEMTTQAAGLLVTLKHSPVPHYNSYQTKGWALGVLRTVYKAKFISFAKPGDRLVIKVNLIDKIDNLFRFKGSIYSNDKKIMSNEFGLVNIPDTSILD